MPAMSAHVDALMTHSDSTRLFKHSQLAIPTSSGPVLLSRATGCHRKEDYLIVSRVYILPVSHVCYIPLPWALTSRRYSKQKKKTILSKTRSRFGGTPLALPRMRHSALRPSISLAALPVFVSVDPLRLCPCIDFRAVSKTFPWL